MPGPQSAAGQGAPHAPRFIVVMGVAGTGKSEIGRRLADVLQCAFVEADELHSPKNVASMSKGIPLTDAMRMPWLGAVCDRALSMPRHPVVIACSVLKRSYRELLRERLSGTRFLYLNGSPHLIAERLGSRKGHFAKETLLASQLRTLEAPGDDEAAIWLDIALPPIELVDIALTKLDRTGVSA